MLHLVLLYKHLVESINTLKDCMQNAHVVYQKKNNSIFINVLQFILPVCFVALDQFIS